MAKSGGVKKEGLATTAIVVLLLSLMGAGAGFAVGVFLQPAKETGKDGTQGPPTTASGSTGSAKAADESKATAEHAEPSTPADEAAEGHVTYANLKIIPVPPVLTTLVEPQGKWVRLEGSILADPGSDEPPELLAERAGEQILGYLRTVRLSQIQGASGFLALRDDLNEMLMTLSGGAVKGILIHGLLVE